MSALHILNGDAFASVFEPPAKSDRVAVFRSALFEGPIGPGPFEPPLRTLRDHFYVSEYGADAEMVARWTDEDRSVTETNHHSVTLWFEDDLYCAVNLIYLVATLRAGQLHLVMTHVPHERLGSGVTGARVRELYDSRQIIGERELHEVRGAWSAYASTDYETLADAAAAASWAPVRLMFDRHLRRFPSAANGLDPIENAILVKTEEGGEDLIPNVLSKSEIFGATDVAVIKRMQRLAAEPLPLVRFSGQDSRAELTSDGASVLRGEADAIRLRGIDRWLGGIHLEGSGTMPRWDGARLVMA